jgi:hypothetical protein
MGCIEGQGRLVALTLSPARRSSLRTRVCGRVGGPQSEAASEALHTAVDDSTHRPRGHARQRRSQREQLGAVETTTGTEGGCGAGGATAGVLRIAARAHVH